MLAKSGWTETSISQKLVPLPLNSYENVPVVCYNEWSNEITKACTIERIFTVLTLYFVMAERLSLLFVRFQM